MIPLSDTRSSGSFPFWVIVIIAINVYIFFRELVAPDSDVFIFHYALTPSLVDPTNFSTLTPFITSQFLHGGFIHIISNMWFLWIFGDNVEHRLGFFFFPVFYLLAGMVGNLLQYSFYPASDIPMLGASGAIAGVLGAYMAFFPDHKIKTLIPIFLFFTIINIPASIMLFYWLVIQLFSSATSTSNLSSQTGGIAYFAHIRGFAIGWFLGKLMLRF